MRQLLFISVFLGLMFVGQAQKVGYTSVELLLNYMPEAKQVEIELDQLTKTLTVVLEMKQKYYQSKVMEYQQKEQDGMSPESLQSLADEITQLEKEIQETLAESELKVSNRRMELLEPLTARIQAAVDAVAQENGFTYILNNAVGGGIPTILYGLETSEVTNSIAKKLGISVPQ